MVAIKAAHERLNAKDLWPGLPWSWKDTIRIQDECRQKAIDSGITEHPHLQFAAAREYERYMSMFPKYGARQKIIQNLYSNKQVKIPSDELSASELQYLVERLFGVNDKFGIELRAKLERMIYAKSI
jgi:hypothetical protein